VDRERASAKARADDFSRLTARVEDDIGLIHETDPTLTPMPGEVSIGHSVPQLRKARSVCILDNGDTVTVEHGVRHRLVDTTESVEFVDDQAADSPLFQDILGIGLDECAPKFLSDYRLAR